MQEKKIIPSEPFGRGDQGEEIGIKLNDKGDREYDLEFIANNLSLIPIRISPKELPSEALTEVIVCSSFGTHSVSISSYKTTDVKELDYYLAPQITDFSGFRPNRYYKHESGKYIKTYTPVETFSYEVGLLYETTAGEFAIAGFGDQHFIGWEEATEEEFKTNSFKTNSEDLQNSYKEFLKRQIFNKIQEKIDLDFQQAIKGFGIYGQNLEDLLQTIHLKVGKRIKPDAFPMKELLNYQVTPPEIITDFSLMDAIAKAIFNESEIAKFSVYFTVDEIAEQMRKSN